MNSDPTEPTTENPPEEAEVVAAVVADAAQESANQAEERAVPTAPPKEGDAREATEAVNAEEATEAANVEPTEAATAEESAEAPTTGPPIVIEPAEEQNPQPKPTETNKKVPVVKSSGFSCFPCLAKKNKVAPA